MGKLNEAKILNFPTPDDSGNTWVPPHLWTPTEIHNLVIREVGVDQIYPRGFQVLIKLWMPPKVDEIGLEVSDFKRRNEMLSCTIGMVLRMGADAFDDTNRFSSGARVTYGEWGIFRGTERQQISQMTEDGEARLAFINDDRFLAAVADPSTLKTSFDLETEWADH